MREHGKRKDRPESIQLTQKTTGQGARAETANPFIFKQQSSNQLEDRVLVKSTEPTSNGIQS